MRTRSAEEAACADGRLRGRLAEHLRPDELIQAAARAAKHLQLGARRFRAGLQFGAPHKGPACLARRAIATNCFLYGHGSTPSDRLLYYAPCRLRVPLPRM